MNDLLEIVADFLWVGGILLLCSIGFLPSVGFTKWLKKQVASRRQK
jgi:hypothetical protein